MMLVDDSAVKVCYYVSFFGLIIYQYVERALKSITLYRIKSFLVLRDYLYQLTLSASCE
jgi:hypothetical protein